MIRAEQHFFATDEFPGVERHGIESGYRMVACSREISEADQRRISQVVALEAPTPKLTAILDQWGLPLDQWGLPHIDALGVWPLGEKRVVVSCARIFPHMPGARPYTYFVHSLVLAEAAYAEELEANPFRLVRGGAFANRPPPVPTRQDKLIEPRTLDAREYPPPAAPEQLREQFAHRAGPDALVAMLQTAIASDRPPALLADADLARCPAILEGLLLALPLGVRRSFWFWSFRFRSDEMGPFRFLLVPSATETEPAVAARVTSIVLGMKLEFVAALDSFAATAAGLACRSQATDLGKLLSFVEDYGLDGTPGHLDVAVGLWTRYCQYQGGASTIDHLLDVTRGLFAVKRPRAARAAIDQLGKAIAVDLIPELGPRGSLSAAVAVLREASSYLAQEKLDDDVARMVTRWWQSACQEPPEAWQTALLTEVYNAEFLPREKRLELAQRWVLRLGPGEARDGILEPLRQAFCVKTWDDAIAHHLLDLALSRDGEYGAWGPVLSKLCLKDETLCEPRQALEWAIRLDMVPLAYEGLRRVMRGRPGEESVSLRNVMPQFFSRQADCRGRLTAMILERDAEISVLTGVARANALADLAHWVHVFKGLLTPDARLLHVLNRAYRKVIPKSASQPLIPRRIEFLKNALPCCLGWLHEPGFARLAVRLYASVLVLRPDFHRADIEQKLWVAAATDEQVIRWLLRSRRGEELDQARGVGRMLVAPNLSRKTRRVMHDLLARAPRETTRVIFRALQLAATEDGFDPRKQVYAELLDLWRDAMHPPPKPAPPPPSPSHPTAATEEWLEDDLILQVRQSCPSLSAESADTAPQEAPGFFRRWRLLWIALIALAAGTATVFGIIKVRSVTRRVTANPIRICCTTPMDDGPAASPKENPCACYGLSERSC